MGKQTWSRLLRETAQACLRITWDPNVAFTKGKWVSTIILSKQFLFGKLVPIQWLHNTSDHLLFYGLSRKAGTTLQFSSVQSLSRVRLSVTPWVTVRQASLSITNSQSSLKLMSIKSVMPSSYLIFCLPLLLLPQIPPSIRVFSNESTLRMRCPKKVSASASFPPKKSQGWSPSEWTGWISLDT